MNTATTIRLTLATIRLTRAITVDDIGEWWIKNPIDHAMHQYETNHTRIVPETARTGSTLAWLGNSTRFDQPWWWKYRDGLDCGWCTSFHVAWVLYAGEALLGRTRLWRGITGALALSQAAATIGELLGTYDNPEDD